LTAIAGNLTTIHQPEIQEDDGGEKESGPLALPPSVEHRPDFLSSHRSSVSGTCG